MSANHLRRQQLALLFDYPPSSQDLIQFPLCRITGISYLKLLSLIAASNGNYDAFLASIYTEPHEVPNPQYWITLTKYIHKYVTEYKKRLYMAIEKVQKDHKWATALRIPVAILEDVLPDLPTVRNFVEEITPDLGTIAKANVISAILNGDKHMSKWWLETTEPENFGKKPKENTGDLIVNVTHE